MNDDKRCPDCPLLTNRVTALEDMVNKIKQAFPEEDYDGHRRGHLALIRQTEAKERLAAAIKEKTISGLIWAAIVGLGTLLWQGLKGKLGGF